MYCPVGGAPDRTGYYLGPGIIYRVTADEDQNYG